jgi:BirA family biotin operon repressor/biotin-[acetyl-CoA-carboxylase] ligase
VTIRYRRRTESTNDDIRRLAAAGAPEGTVALAEEQTAGRGRFGRTWDSAAGLGVWMTVLFRPGEGCRDAGLYPVAAAVAACRALRRLGAPEAGVKWPNDILWRGRKLCGILCEGASSGGAVEWVAVGVGVDVLHTEDQLPSVPGLPPVSLALCRKAAEDGASGDPTESGAPDGDDLRARTAAALLYELEETGRMVATGATRELVDEYRRMSLLIGRDVRIESPGGTFEARATGIDEEGRLLVEAPDGPRALVNGEVTVRTVQEGRT